MNRPSRPRIALDAMGGDDAPGPIVAGAVEAVENFHEELQVVLVGDQDAIHACLPRERAADLGIEIVHTTQTIGMGESAANSFRKKPDSSISVATRLVSKGEADAMVSAGNTGAVVTAGLLGLGRIKNVQRPALASVLPTISGRCLLLDVGANTECKVSHLAQFAIMGKVYSECVLGTERPRVGLLNIGEESSKGTELTQMTHKALDGIQGGLNFVGNVEGRDVLGGTVDVVVCDGFMGNVLLKFAESMIGVVTSTIREGLRRSIVYRLGALLMKPVFGTLKTKMSYEEVGGAPLLGVNGTVFVAHGSSTPKAIRNAIRFAATDAREGVVVKIGEELARELRKEEAAG